MNYPAASRGVSSSVLARHSVLDTESSRAFWIPAGVRPGENRGQYDELAASRGGNEPSWIQLREGMPAASRDFVEGVILHLSAKGHPLEIEILDASKVVQKKDVEVSMEALFSGS
jgi:hypothetical protein